MAAVLALAMAVPAAADVLVMQNGAHVRTKGTWKVKGSVVVFTLPNGTLSSVRTREVDLDRSAQVTAALRAEALQATRVTEPPPRPVVRDITSADIPLASPQVLAAEAAAARGEETGTGGEAAGPGQNRLLEIADWRQAEQPDGTVEIVGEIRNKTDSAVGQVAVKVTVYRDGQALKSGYAFLAAPALGPGRSTSFRMPLEDVTVFDDVRFDLEGLEILLRATGAGASTGEEGPSS